MNWIDFSSDKKAKAARCNWLARKMLKSYSYDEDCQCIMNRFIESFGNSPKRNAWKMFMCGNLKNRGRTKTRGGRDQDR